MLMGPVSSSRKSRTTDAVRISGRDSVVRLYFYETDLGSIKSRLVPVARPVRGDYPFDDRGYPTDCSNLELRKGLIAAIIVWLKKYSQNLACLCPSRREKR